MSSSSEDLAMMIKTNCLFFKLAVVLFAMVQQLPTAIDVAHLFEDCNHGGFTNNEHIQLSEYNIDCAFSDFDLSQLFFDEYNLPLPVKIIEVYNLITLDYICYKGINSIRNHLRGPPFNT